MIVSCVHIIKDALEINGLLNIQEYKKMFNIGNTVNIKCSYRESFYNKSALADT